MKRFVLTKKHCEGLGDNDVYCFLGSDGVVDRFDIGKEDDHYVLYIPDDFPEERKKALTEYLYPNGYLEMHHTEYE